MAGDLVLVDVLMDAICVRPGDSVCEDVRCDFCGHASCIAAALMANRATLLKATGARFTHCATHEDDCYGNGVAGGSCVPDAAEWDA